MIKKSTLFILIITAFFQAAASGKYSIPQAKHQIKQLEFSFTDTKRKRDIPVKIYVPKANGPFPVIIFSHGLAGTKDGYEFLGTYWSQRGYISVHPQHKGSDRDILKGVATKDKMKVLKKTKSKTKNATNRPKDISFVIDKLQALNKSDRELKGKIDLKRIGMAGHSFGAHTTMMIGGQVYPIIFGFKYSLEDKRVKAIMPMSNPASKDHGKPKFMFKDISLPCMHMTGTLDDSPVGETSAKERREAYDIISIPDQYLITFQGGDHMIFCGKVFKPVKTQQDKIFESLICDSSIVFWQAYLNDDAQAKDWLINGGLEKKLDSQAKLEKKITSIKR